ncbi:MAG TPA: RNA polymerase sigma factor [Candidatus Paceibacterota bacterium]|nr:RNA polymerase sigma factor [Verrucomicrobiota bacterium]HRZ45816.1 RNA polymerase sigma factor [Candidatus Paceibacterota bacterium]HRZ94184.1 RNA polymerase sigma factor [Candidatus Paceibacterota bacterium]
MNESEQFEAFMRDHQDMVYTVAIRLLGNDADAQDVCQETFLRAYDRFAELIKTQTVGGWLRTVARNLALNHLTRYRARWRFFSEMMPEGEEGQFEADLAAPPESNAPGDADRWADLEDVLRRLPEHQRVPLVLFHFEELSYEEIARRLGVSLSKVKTDIHRARQSLAKKMEQMGLLADGSRAAEGCGGCG